MLSSLPNATSKTFSTCTSANHKSGLAAKTCKHPSLVFHKFEYPMKNTVKHNKIVFSTPGLLQPLPINIDTVASSAEILCSTSASVLLSYSETFQLHITRLSEKFVEL